MINFNAEDPAKNSNFALVISRYFLELSYDGTLYHGWQTQPNGITVQQCLDEALSTCFRQTVNTTGCGRTDAGVHASKFFAHFDLADLEENVIINALNAINALLPYQIAIKKIFKVNDLAHARFDATARTYHYFIHFTKDPFKLNKSWLYKDNLNLNAMNAAAALMLNYTDFSCFTKAKSQTFTNNCYLSEAYFTPVNNGLVFTITADRFLRNMVRAIVGTMILVGKEAIKPEEIMQIIEAKNRSAAGQSVPACGLYLAGIKYPFLSEKLENN